MRNYVFIKNKTALHLIEGHLEKYSYQSSLSISQNNKGTVLTFQSEYWVKHLKDFVQFERNEVAFSMAVEPFTEEENQQANNLIRTLTRISLELETMETNFKVKAYTH